jgi:hypothetical protein
MDKYMKNVIWKSVKRELEKIVKDVEMSSEAGPENTIDLKTIVQEYQNTLGKEG